MSTPRNDAFNIYDEIKSKLLEEGIPESEIAYIHNAKQMLKRKNSFLRFEKVK